jgi:hypothetical protein
MIALGGARRGGVFSARNRHDARPGRCMSDGNDGGFGFWSSLQRLRPAGA